MIAEQELGTVNWYSDIPSILVDAGYLESELKEKWLQMIGLRNVLVHEYLEIDRAIVFDALQNRLGDIKALKLVFAQFL